MFVGLLVYIILTLAMLVSVMCFETDCKKIIFWNLIIVLTSIFGFGVYFVCFCDKPHIRKNIKKKFEQDEIYKNLIEYSTGKTNSNNETLNFTKRHFSAEIFKNSDIKVIDNIDAFVNSVVSDIEKAEDYIIIDTEIFLSVIGNENIVSLLKEKKSLGVDVRCIYGKRKFSDRKTIKELVTAGVRVSKFNKSDCFNKYYKNSKNLITVDGKKVYLYNSFKLKFADKPISHSCLFYILQGEVLKSINLDCYLDVTFATQKVYEIDNLNTVPVGDTEMQYVSSVADMDFEALFLKAINDAKKRIVIHINKFIPTPSIKQAIQMAIMSGIDVKIMIAKNCAKYYASRAYLKEMAMYGATAYIYDGMISSNFIIIDNLTFIGNFSLVNLEIRNNLQNTLIINNAEFTNNTKDYFGEMVNNSYRICKPKNVLLREKIFKKFN